MNAVPCLSWIKRGAAKRLPDRIQLGADELTDLVKNMEATAIEDDDSSNSDDEIQTPNPKGGKRKHSDSDHSSEKEKAKAAAKKMGKVSEIDDKYDLDDYDDEDEADGGGFGMQGISYYSTNKDDPYLAKITGGDDTDEEDIEITKEDNLIACGKMTGDYFNLEVYVYNEIDNNIYCHHDTILATFPLCMEWIEFDPGEEEAGNLLAIGSMEPDIEIWDLDVMGSLEPAYVLAGSKKPKSKGKKKKKAEISGHTDAVLGLSWNALQKNVLASASADFTVGLWDVENGKMVSSIQHHKEKVQTICWHPFEPQTLLSGSFDHTAKVYDCRSPDSSHKSWTLPGEVERVLWNHHDPYCFLASSDTGHLYHMDVRTEKPLFTLSAHTGAVSGLSLSSSVAGCLVTCSDDKEVKVWDIRDNAPKIVHTQTPKIGVIHCCAGCPDAGLVFAVGGERELKVVNFNKNSSITSHFGLTTENANATEPEIVGAGNEDRDSETEEIFGSVEGSGSTAQEYVNAKENAVPSTSSASLISDGKKKKKKKKKPNKSN